MSIADKEQEIIAAFSMFDEWLDKYEYIIELGKDLPAIEEKYKVDKNLINGCQSKVWLHSEKRQGKMYFTSDSDAIITKGIIGLLIQVVNGESPEDVAKFNFDFISKIGLQEHLSPTRSNGLLSMVKKMKMEALIALKP